MVSKCAITCDGYQCDGSHEKSFEGEIIHTAFQNGVGVRVWLNKSTPHWKSHSDEE